MTNPQSEGRQRRRRAAIAEQKRKEEVEKRRLEARTRRERMTAERATRLQEERERAVARGSGCPAGELEQGGEDEAEELSVASGGSEVGMNTNALEEQGLIDQEEEEDEMKAMKLLGKALTVETNHPTALVMRALLLMSTAVRVRNRNGIRRARHVHATQKTEGQGAAGGGCGEGGNDDGEQDGSGQLVSEAEKLLCRVLSSDPHYGPALMAVAELLWHPMLLNRPIGAESIYRYVMTGTDHLSKGWGGADAAGADVPELPEAMYRIDVQERRFVSYNLALLLTLRSADVGNAAACVEAEELLHRSEQLMLQAFPNQPSQHAGADFLRGRLALSRRLYSRAEAFLRRVLSVNPRHADAKVWLATALADKVWTLDDTTNARHINVALSRWLNKLLHKCFGAWAGSTSEMRSLRRHKHLIGLPGADAHVRAEGRISRWNEAIMLAHEVLDADPWHAQSRLLLANIYLDHLQNPARALRMIQPTIQDELAAATGERGEGKIKREGYSKGVAGVKHSKFTGIFEDGDRGTRIRRQSLLLGARILHESENSGACFRLLKMALVEFPEEPSLLMYLLRLMLRGRAGKTFVQADTDGSGALSFAEFAAMEINKGVDEAQLRAVFDKLDVDHDGAVSFEEWTAGQEEQELAGSDRVAGKVGTSSAVGSSEEVTRYAAVLAEVAAHDAEALHLAALAFATQGEYERSRNLRLQAGRAVLAVGDDAASMPYQFATLGELGSLL